MRAFQRHVTAGSYFSLVSELFPTKSWNLTYFFINLYIYLILTFDMMTRQKFYI
ncbi:hypothetical protein O3M35_007982 [Rhynocoris fuscipes]|uniref:Uncharacterized protein n=1 Tax=Rhynocoris fuscipes TaxID=488301 RepID=A0AAW1DEX2_9HEMI